MDPPNRKQILVGLSALFAGLLIYIVDRPPDQIYFLYKTNLPISLYHLLPCTVIPLGDHLPSFIHVFSWAVVTGGLTACKKRGAVLICLAWFVTDCIFELGQKFSDLAASIIPRCFENILLLENMEGYFRGGTFDLADLLSTTLGAVTAYLVLVGTMERRTT
jgi:hypothetical protein